MIGVMILIIYKDVLAKLKAAGYNTNRLRLEQLLPESTIQSIRSNSDISTKSINTICRLLGCQPNEIMEYIPNELETTRTTRPYDE
jgi:putative transcriptional regulator